MGTPILLVTPSRSLQDPAAKTCMDVIERWANNPSRNTLTTKLVTGAYRMSVDDDFLKVDATAASFALTLQAGPDGKLIVIKKKTAANVVTVTAPAGWTIDGAGSVALTLQYSVFYAVAMTDDKTWNRIV